MAAERYILNDGESGEIIRNKINNNFHTTYAFTTGTTAATLTNINSRVLKTAFNSYTATTQQELNSLNEISIVTVTGTTGLTSTAFGKIINCIGTVTNYTIDLPTAVGNNGSIIFKGSSVLTKTVTIQGVLGQTIDGESDRKIGSTGMITVMSDGANWVVINEVGSWIPYTAVLAGWSSDPTFDRMMYFRVGKKVSVSIHTTANGTSNAVTKTITFPFIADSSAAQVGISGPNINNGIVDTTHGMVITRVGSNIVDFYRNVSSLAWTASGGCRINFTMDYIIA
jgi:hypothetical protein